MGGLPGNTTSRFRALEEVIDSTGSDTSVDASSSGSTNSTDGSSSPSAVSEEPLRPEIVIANEWKTVSWSRWGYAWLGAPAKIGYRHSSKMVFAIAEMSSNTGESPSLSFSLQGGMDVLSYD